MNSDKSRFVVDADWVEKQLGAPEFRIVDASWYLPVQNRNGAAEYASGHVPGAVFFDQDVIADHTSGLPHTIPTPEMFASEVEKLGIADTDTIVVYDGPGIFTAPRVWWLFRLMGAENVFVMDGGIDGWKREGRPLQTDLPEPAPAVFNVRFDASRVTSFDAMKDIVATGSSQIADARGAGRFTGVEAEPREGMRSGHMPGAKSLPSGVFSTDGKFKSLTDLKQTIEAAGIDLSKPVVTSCGSGVTAAIITLALQSLGHNANTLYDGSWSEWGSRQDTAVVTGQE
jgi:thiosulfate/3-mercaptopyruvate sulfurtransferase